jgi:hypothetical protein
MNERMYRAQILLTPEQRRKLEEIARREGRSISAVTRFIIDIGLKNIEREADIWKKRERVLQEFREIRERQPTTYQGDLINEARQERDDEMDRIWQDES